MEVVNRQKNEEEGECNERAGWVRCSAYTDSANPKVGTG